MKVLFISLISMEDLNDQNLYSDLLKTFKLHGHDVYTAVPREQRANLPTEMTESNGVRLLKIKVCNITKCGFIEKGISTLLIQGQFKRAINYYYGDVIFDLIIYSTPPTTFYGLIGWLKRRTGARTYLWLKDIFPQNSIDLGLLSKSGIKGALYRYFKMTEKRTYAAADFIGCMSPANMNYLLTNEPHILKERVEINPNSIIPRSINYQSKKELREEMNISQSEKIIVYGGNLGKPQAIGFLIRSLELNEEQHAAYFVIAGDGTERYLLEDYFKDRQPKYAKLLPNLSPKDFDRILMCADAGLVLLDARFTIPNFPSRILSYMQASLPLIAATDDATDLGLLAEANNFGRYCSSRDEQEYINLCGSLKLSELKEMGLKAREYLDKYYTSEQSYQMIMRHFNER